MSDPPFYTPNRAPATRLPQPAEHLWVIQKDDRQLACELRDDGTFEARGV